MQDIKELGFILMIIMLVIAGVQWFFVRFTHWSVALIATGIIAFIISFIYVSLSHASPNGGGGRTNSSEYIAPMLIIFAALLCGFVVVCHFAQIQLPKKAFVYPMTLLIVFAIGSFAYKYVKNATTYFRLFSKCEIEIIDETEGKSNIREISFKDTTSSLVSNVDINSSSPPYPRLTRNASNIIFLRYTEAKGMSHQNFPFDYNLCQEKEGDIVGFCFWLRQKVVLPMKIVIHSDEKVDLYLGGNLVQQYQLKDDLSLNKKVKRR